MVESNITQKTGTETHLLQNKFYLFTINYSHLFFPFITLITLKLVSEFSYDCI